MIALKVFGVLLLFDVVIVGLWVLIVEVRSRRGPLDRMTGIELDVFGCIQQCPRVDRHESDRKYRRRLGKHMRALEEARRARSSDAR